MAGTLLDGSACSHSVSDIGNPSQVPPFRAHLVQGLVTCCLSLSVHLPTRETC